MRAGGSGIPGGTWSAGARRPVSVPEDVLYGSIRELSEGIRTRKLSPVELAEAYLQRLEQLGPRLGAVVTITRERALREARAAEREIAAGQWRGPLHGVPYGVKDLLSTAGDLTTWGAAPYREQRFDFDATIVQRLTARSHESSRWPVISAAMPKANGMVIPTKPMYSDGGWITIQ